MKITGTPTKTRNNVYTGGLPKSKHSDLGVYSQKDYDNAKNLAIGLAIGGIGLLIALVIELF